MMVDTENLPESKQDSAQQVLDFIHQLPHLDRENKDWAEQDALHRIAVEDISLGELEEKYSFYDQMAAVRDDILANVPAGKRTDLLRFINDILNTSSRGGRREEKKWQLLRVQHFVQSFQNDKSLLRFRVARMDDIDKRVLDILADREQADYIEHYEKVFPSLFWTAFDTLEDRECPHLRKVFPYSTPLDLLADITDFRTLKELPKKIKGAIKQEIEILMSSFFSTDEQKKQRGILNGLNEKEPQKLIEFLQKIQTQKQEKQREAEREFARIEIYFAYKNTLAAEKSLQSLQKNYGENILMALGKKGFERQLAQRTKRINELKQQLKTTQDAEKREKITAKIQKLDSESANFLADSAQQAQRKKLVKPILDQLQEQRKTGDFKAAKKTALRLFGLDDERARQELATLDEEIRKQELTSGGAEETVDTSHEKQQKITFLEKCIEHAEKVKESCQQLGIPTDNPEFWGPQGIKKRQEWLMKNGLYDTYRKFHESDPNMPKRSAAETFVRFRWLDLRTGNNLTGANAESGIRFLNRFKESGYHLAALAGALSMNWKSPSSPTYDPSRFISLVNEELIKVKGE